MLASEQPLALAGLGWNPTVSLDRSDHGGLTSSDTHRTLLAGKPVGVLFTLNDPD